MGDRLGLLDLLLIAEWVLGEPAGRLQRSVSFPAAESALAAPFANFNGVEIFPDPVQRAALVCSGIIRHQPFPRGNQWIAFECMREMLERDGFLWPLEAGAEIAGMVNALAEGSLSEEDFVSWVSARVRASDPETSNGEIQEGEDGE